MWSARLTPSTPRASATIGKLVAATIKGSANAIADFAMTAKLVVDTYGKSLNRDLDAQMLTAEAVTPLVETDETRAHGRLVMTDVGIAQNMKTLKQSVIGHDVDFGQKGLEIAHGAGSRGRPGNDARTVATRDPSFKPKQLTPNVRCPGLGP
jgi:hypothetical protein